MNNKLKVWLSGILGAKLKSVNALIYSFEGEKNFINPQEINLRFSSVIDGVLVCASDGASLEWQNAFSGEVDMGSSGAQIIEDISDKLPWCMAVNLMLVAVQLVESGIEQCLIGMRFEFEENIFISVLNLGDEIYVYEEIPLEVIADQQIRLVDFR